MSVDGDLLERIVAGVLRELGGENATTRPHEATMPSVPNEIILTEKVITAELLEKRGPAAGILVIGRAAIVTPSARDFLRRNNVQFRVDSKMKDNGRGSESVAAANWKIIVVRTTKNLTALLDDAARWPGVAWQRELAGCDIDAAERATSALCRAEAEGSIVFTSHPEVVACRANRNSKVRGAAVENIARIRSARKQMGANLYCIDPEGRLQHELRNLLREAVACPRPLRPKHWKES